MAIVLKSGLVAAAHKSMSRDSSATDLWPNHPFTAARGKERPARAQHTQNHAAHRHSFPRVDLFFPLHIINISLYNIVCIRAARTSCTVPCLRFRFFQCVKRNLSGGRFLSKIKSPIIYSSVYFFLSRVYDDYYFL